MEHFVREIEAAEVLDRVQRVHDWRVAQIDDGRRFSAEYNKLLRAYREIVQLNTGERNILTPQEQALLDRQQHYDFGELSKQEQVKLQGEVDSLFGQIPAHLQEKARKLAGVN